MEVCKIDMKVDESKNMENSVGERCRELSEIKVMNDHYCMALPLFSIILRKRNILLFIWFVCIFIYTLDSFAIHIINKMVILDNAIQGPKIL